MSLVSEKSRFVFVIGLGACVVLAFGCIKSKGRGSDLIVIDDEQDGHFDQSEGDSRGTEGADEGAGDVVRLEIYAMSKCPHFARLITVLKPIIQSMGDNVELAINYVGKAQGDQIVCAHGPQEVGGNIIQLCAGKYGTQEQLVEFIECQSELLSAIPDDWEECAEQARIDVAKMTRCYKSGLGRDLLRLSVSEAQKNGIDASPVVFLNGKPYEKARAEVSIARAICKELGDPKPKACSTYAPAALVSATVINDERCPDQDCDPEIVDKFIHRSLDSVEVRKLDYADDEAKALFAKSGFKHLPIVVFDDAIKKEEDAYWQLSKLMSELDDGTFAYPIGRTWDPSKEICDDGMDNTGDGKVDCEDDHCRGRWICREQKRRELKLFIMSYCPYCTDVLRDMKRVLDHFGNDPKNMDFSLEFYGENVEGELYSMHGESEVEEDLRQICAQKHFRKDYKFMDYLLCRADAFEKSGLDDSQDAWEACAKDGIKASIIKECAKGREGRKLLAESFAFTERLGIKGTPYWLLNNRYPMEGRSQKQIIDSFCRRNKEAKGCKGPKTGATPR